MTVPDAGGTESTLRDVAEELLRIETHGRRYYESRLEEGETVTVRGRVASDEGRPDDRRRDLGVLVEADLVADATPAGTAGRGLRGAAVSVAAGLFVLLVVGAFLLVLV